MYKYIKNNLLLLFLYMKIKDANSHYENEKLRE